jgi:phosphoribosylformylglycinamidine cyclo-ligase
MHVPPVPPVLAFMQREAKLDNAEAYGTLNMGAGFAFFVTADQAEQTVAIAKACGIDAWVAGRLEAGSKQVIIEPIGVTYGTDDLKLR